MWLFCLLTTMLAWLHPIYVSLAELEYNCKTSKFELAIKVFDDDLNEYAGKTKLDPKQIIIQEFLLEIDGKQVTFSAQGEEKVADAKWLYYESERAVLLGSKYQLTNKILMGLHKGQTNITTIKSGSGVTRHLHTINEPLTNGEAKKDFGCQ